MPLLNKGLNKMMEELSELGQIAAKKSEYMHVEVHPDGKAMTPRFIEEMGDVEATMEFVKQQFDLDRAAIEQRKQWKLNRLRAWHIRPGIYTPPQ